MTKKERLHIELENAGLDYDAIDRVLESDEFGRMDLDMLTDALEARNAFDSEFIYYSDAQDYVSKHDYSLSRSMGIADEMGYRPKDIDICLLASLLSAEISRDDYYENSDRIKRLLEEAQEEE